MDTTVSEILGTNHRTRISGNFTHRESLIVPIKLSLDLETPPLTLLYPGTAQHNSGSIDAS